MRYRLRLNGTQDADLIALYRTGYPLGQAFADAARIYFGGAEITLPDTPPYPDGVPLDLSDVRISITIPDNAPGGKEAVAAMENIGKGFRALVLRCCLRNALPAPYIGMFTGTGVTVIKKEKKEIPSSASEITAGELEGDVSAYRNDVQDNVPATVSSVPDSTVTAYWHDAETTHEDTPGTPYKAAGPDPAQEEDGVRETSNIHRSLFGGFVEEY